MESHTAVQVSATHPPSLTSSPSNPLAHQKKNRLYTLDLAVRTPPQDACLFVKSASGGFELRNWGQNSALCSNIKTEYSPDSFFSEGHGWNTQVFVHLPWTVTDAWKWTQKGRGREAPALQCRG